MTTTTQSTLLRRPPLLRAHSVQLLAQNELPPDTRIDLRAVAGLAAFGATCGPLVDAVHNQALLEYDVLPITIAIFNAKTSLLIPPLLGLTYALLGSVLPVVSEALVGRGRTAQPVTLSLASTAAFAVASTISIIKLSELLFTAPWLPAGGSAILLFACLLREYFWSRTCPPSLRSRQIDG